MEKRRRNLKKRIFDIIQIGNREDAPSRAFDYFIVAVILLNITCMFLDTFDQLEPLFPLFDVIESLTVLIFLLEYLLRIWTADLLYPNETRPKAVLHFLRSYDGVVDLLTILPFFFLSGFVAFRMLRVVRIFHLFRINANYDSFNVITAVLYDKRNQLLSSLFIIIVLIMASSLCMYSAEHAAQPESFENAFSGIWWSVSTLLTVGYGDIYPITLLGRVMAIIISFLGVMAVAIPTGIISAGFVEHYRKVKYSTPFGDVKMDTVYIELDSPWRNKSVSEIRFREGAVVVLIRRDGGMIVPEPHTRVEAGDELMVYRTGDVK